MGRRIIHIGPTAIIRITVTNNSIYSIIILGIGHGISSPIIFNFIGVIKSRSKSLSYYHGRRILKHNKLLIVIVISSCLLNIGIPPTINFLGEIITISIILNFSYYLVLIISILVLFNGLYNTYILLNLSYKKINIKVENNDIYKYLQCIFILVFI